MAEIQIALTPVSTDSYEVKYEAMGNADTGQASSLTGFPGKTVNVSGTFGSATVVIQGSDDKSVWLTLNDASASPLSFTAASGYKVILENPRYIRASTSGGSGTDIDVVIVAVR